VVRTEPKVYGTVKTNKKLGEKTMFSKKSLVLLIAFVFLSLVGVSTAQNGGQCYTLASLNGTYGVVGEYGAHVAIALATRHFDGNGNLTGAFTVNAPDPASTTGGRKLITGTQIGTYTVNCDGTGVFTRVLTVNGVTTNQFDDFIITAAKVKDGQLIATTIDDAQRTPSAIVLGGIFLTRHYTLRPDGGADN
jgi:hypothetical protein